MWLSYCCFKKHFWLALWFLQQNIIMLHHTVKCEMQPSWFVNWINWFIKNIWLVSANKWLVHKNHSIEFSVKKDNCRSVPYTNESHGFKTGNKSEYVEVDYVHDPFYDGLLSFFEFDIPKTCQDIRKKKTPFVFPKRKSNRFGNDMRVRKLWQNIHLWVNYGFNKNNSLKMPHEMTSRALRVKR